MRRLTAVMFIACNGLLDHHPGVLCGSPTDPANCGTCGHDCLSGACVDGACQSVVLASGLDYPSCIAVDDASVYWASFQQGTVVKQGKDGTGAVALVPTPTFTNIRAPASLAVDGNGNLYWANTDSTNAGQLYQSVYERSATGSFLSLGGSYWPAVVTLAPDGRIYWTTVEDPAAVMRAQPGIPNSATPLVTHAGADGGPTGHGNIGIAVDGAHVYWVDWYSGGIYSTPIDQPCVEETTCTLLFTDSTCLTATTCGFNGKETTFGPVALVLDATTLYWTNTNDRTLKRMEKDGTGERTLATGQGQAQALAIADGQLFWGNFGDATIRTMKTTDPPCDQTTCKVLAPYQPYPSSIAVDEHAIYWTSQQAGTGMNDSDSGTIVKLAR